MKSTPTSISNAGEAGFVESAFLKTLVASTRDAVLLMNAEGIVFYQNAAAAQISGRSDEEVIGVRYYNYVDDVSRLELDDFMQKALNTPGSSQQGIFKIIHKSGKYVWVQGVTTNLLHDPNVNALIATYHDITDKKDVEQALLESEAKLRTILESTDDAIVFIDTNCIVNSFNHKASEVVFEEMGGTLKLGQHCLAYSKPGRREILEAALKSVFAGKELKFEQHYKKEDSTDTWYYVRMQRAVDSRGDISGLTISVTDVTKRKTAELALAKTVANLHTVFNNTDDGILLIDTDLKLVSFNQKAQQFTIKDLKRTLQEGEYVLDYFNSDMRPFREKAFVQVLQGNNISYEISHAQPDGSYTWYFIRMINVKDEATGSILGLTMQLTDITKRKQAEQATILLNEQLEMKVQERTASLQQLNKELEAFTYSVSHDLKTPAHIINRLAKVLTQQHTEKLDEEPKQVVDEILKYSGHMEMLINDLLLLSKSASSEIYKEKCNMRQNIESAITETKDAQLNDKAIIKVGDILDSHCDNGLVKLVWANLISNALKYSLKIANPIIEIGSYKEPKQVVYFVKDNGIGFNYEYRDKIFQVFQRLHTLDEYQGTGIGLALAQRIIYRHCGKIWAESEIGKGATFYFSLPAIS